MYTCVYDYSSTHCNKPFALVAARSNSLIKEAKILSYFFESALCKHLIGTFILLKMEDKDDIEFVVAKSRGRPRKTTEAITH